MDYMEMSKKKRSAEAKSDLIGALYGSELCDLLDLDKRSTFGEQDRWQDFTKALEKIAGDVPAVEKNRMEDLAQNFGNEREETGFRIGFHVAMRLCMEGLNGGVVV